MNMKKLLLLVGVIIGGFEDSRAGDDYNEDITAFSGNRGSSLFFHEFGHNIHHPFKKDPQQSPSQELSVTKDLAQHAGDPRIAVELTGRLLEIPGVLRRAVPPSEDLVLLAHRVFAFGFLKILEHGIKCNDTSLIDRIKLAQIEEGFARSAVISERATRQVNAVFRRLERSKQDGKVDEELWCHCWECLYG